MHPLRTWLARSRWRVLQASCCVLPEFSDRISEAVEAGCTFFLEGGDTLGVVARVTQFTLNVALQIQLLIERIVRGSTDSVLDCCDSLGGLLCELLGKLQCSALQLLVVDHFPDQSPRFSLFGAHLVASQRETQRPCFAYATRQEPCAAGIWNQTNLHKSLDETC